MVVKVLGLTEVERKLRSIPRELGTVVLARALTDAAQVVANAIIRRAEAIPENSDSTTFSSTPLSEHVKVDVTIDADHLGGFANIGFDKQADGRTGKPFDAIAEWVEYGHRMIGHKPDKKQLEGPKTEGGVVKPHPFVRPAFEESKDRAVEVLSEELIAALERGQLPNG